MDLYRYFHPHHNPRLRKRRLRLQEIGELEQAAAEFRHALKRALIRSNGRPEADVLPETLRAMDFVVEAMKVLLRNHPGDSTRALRQILKERENAPGWESWCMLIRQRLNLLSGQEIIAAGPQKPRANSGLKDVA